MFTLLAALAVAVPPADTVWPTSADPGAAPAIQVSLNNDGNYVPGGRVNVRVQTSDDGYLLVLRVDGDGHIRVLFPLDPDGDAFVRGGKEYELRGRDDRQSFLADDRGGNGLVYAAVSHEPYVVRDFSANGHWDYDALRLSDSSTDAENDLTALVATMTNHARFEYDAVGYRVQDLSPIASVPSGGGYYPGFYDPYYDPNWRCLGCGWAYPGSDINFGFNFGYSPFYDPWLYSPWGYNYGAYYGGGYFPGTFPVVVNPGPVRRLPPGTRVRPRPVPPPSNGSGRYRPPQGSAPPPSVRGGAGGAGGSTASPGTRARPRPDDESMMPSRAPSQYVRPVFREPPHGTSVPAQSERPRMQPEPQARPVYREPPHVDRAPSPSMRPSPPPMQRSSPPSVQRSSPPPASSGGGARPRPSGGGGHGGH